MRLIIRNNYEDLSRWAAGFIAERIREARPGTGNPFVLGLPTGSSPLGTYRELIRLHRSGELSFRHVVTFNMDEYAGLAEDHPQSYHAFMWEHLFGSIDIPREQVNLLDGTAGEPAAECLRYEAKMKDLGGVRLFLAGIGADGHLAFNEPGSSLASRTRLKTLARETILANSRFFDGDPARVPRRALTVGVGTVMDAREILLLAAGPAKARAIRKIVEGGVSHMWTASVLQLHPRAVVACDEEAAAELKRGTVRLFRNAEEDRAKSET